MTARALGCVRAAERNDLPELLQLMRELASFEGYLADFAVTELEVERRAFPSSGAPEFFVLVAEDGNESMAGYALCYLIPFTYDLRPTLVIKELFVRTARRSTGIGQSLLSEIERTAHNHRCGWIKWAVMPGNKRAEELYRAWGGEPDAQWTYWRREV